MRYPHLCQQCRRIIRAIVVVLATAGTIDSFHLKVFRGPTLNRATPCSSRRSSPALRQQHRRGGLPELGLFGFGANSGKAAASLSKPARAALESNAAFRSRTQQYARGAITAADCVRALERDVANKVAGCDLEDVVQAALEAIPDKRKRDLLEKASSGRAIGPGGQSSRGSVRGGSDSTVQGVRAEYVMRTGGQRISSGKSIIYNGFQVGKEDTPLKLKVTTRANAALVASELANLKVIKDRNGSRSTARHFVSFIEHVENYNGRGDVVVVMKAESMDLRKLAEAKGGKLALTKLRKYASEMASITRCVHNAGFVWTDLKVDNMLLCRGDELRAIDLEGAVRVRTAPKSFTPDSMPPDFAVASRRGYAGVTVDRSFDVWSLGMAILHLYLGRSYFEGSSDPQTIATLGQPDFAVDLSLVRDWRTRSLLEALLDPDPVKRTRFFDSPACRLALL